MENNKKINENELEILTLTSPLKETIWGSDYFNNSLHLTNNNSIGEMWSCSGYDTFSSIIKNGPFKNKSLAEVYKNNKNLFNNISDINFPLLVKLISTKDKLSIQVHPNDKYAQEVEHYPSGKSECWLILNKSENSSLILGNNAKNKQDLINLVKNNQYEKLINEIKVNIGDLYIVNPGTIHGIGKDLLILEIQQSCDITYRFYDYDRLDKNGQPRQLDIEKAKDNILVPFECQDTYYRYRNHQGVTEINLTDNENFSVYKYVVKGEGELTMPKPYLGAFVIDGEGQIEDVYLKAGDSFLISANVKKLVWKGEMTILAYYG